MAHALVSPVLVGRSREIGLLLAAMQSAANGEGRMILLSGEAGLGKSRLLEAVEQHAAGRWTVMRGRCFEQEISFPYSPWIDALRQFVIPQGPGAAQAFKVIPGGLPTGLAQFLPELLLPTSPEQLPAVLDPENQKRLLFNSVLDWIVQEARTQPVLIEMEDIHWSDEASLDLLRFILRHIPRVPVLILATYRSDEVRPALASFLAEMDRERRAGEIQVAPLPRPEVEQLICHLLGLPLGSRLAIPESVYAWMEGNPFYIEEILQSLLNISRPAGSPERWSESDFEKIEIPRSVQEMVRQRTAALSEAARSLLTLASVSGQQFEGQLLAALSQVEDVIFLGLIRELIGAQFIIEVHGDPMGPGDVYAFRHALTREAIYSSLLGREKKALHLRTARILEALVPANSLYGNTRRLTDLAFHFYEAASWPEAFEYARQAGERSQVLYAPREAAFHFSHALYAARQIKLALPVDCLMGRAQAYELLGDFDSAREDYETALVAVREKSVPGPGDPSSECQILIRLGFLWLARDFRRSGEYFQQALAFAQQQPDQALLGHTLNRVGNWRLNRNQPFEAREYHEQALTIFERLDDLPGLGETLDLLAITHYLCGNMIQGEACFERAIQIWQQLGARQNLVQSLVHVSFPAVVDTEIERPIDPEAQRRRGETALRLAQEMGWRSAEVEAYATLANLSTVGEYDRSLEDALTGLEIAHEIDHHYSLTVLYSHLGEYYLDLFDLPAARQALNQALTVARASGADLLMYRLTALLAVGYLQAGDLAQAEQLLNEAIPEWQPKQSVFMRQAWRVKAQLAQAQGHAAVALHIVDQLIDSAENGPARGERSVAALALLRGEALAALSHALGAADPLITTAEAESELRAAVGLAGLHNRLPLLWRAQISLGRFYLAQKQPEQAAACFDSARALIEQLAGRVPEALREHFRLMALSQISGTAHPTPGSGKKLHPGGLTARELEVAALIARGKTNREIAGELVVGVRTVEAHITRILTRLNFSSRTEIAVWAAANGLVNGSDEGEKHF